MMRFLQLLLSRGTLLASAIACTGLAACSGNDLTLPNLTDPAQIQVLSGDGQTGSVGSQLADPLVVRVLDSRDRPVSGAKVAFVAGFGAIGSVVDPDTATTDTDGRASARWALGSATGSQALEVMVVGNAEVSAAISAVAGVGVAASIAKVSGDNQSATAGSPLADSLVVRALDAGGQPVAGVTVSWAPVGGGSVSAPNSVTRSDGLTGVLRVLGPMAGDQGTTATVLEAAGSPLSFAATARVGSVGALKIPVQPAPTARSGVAFSRQPQVQLEDANNNPVQQVGLAVGAQLGSGPAGAALVGSTTASTNNQGLAAFTNLGISGPSGRYTIVFSAPGTSGATSDPIQVTAGEAVKLAMVTQPPTSVRTGIVLSPAPTVRLEDGTGNGVTQIGVPVSVSLTGSGTLGGTLTVTTGTDGHASFADLVITGAAGDRALLFASNGLASVASGPVHVVSDPDAGKSSITAPGSVTAGDQASVTVTVRDAGSSLLAGIAVTLNASGGANSVVPATATTDGSGRAVFSFSSTRAEAKNLTAAAGSASIGPVGITVTPAAGDAGQTTAVVPNGKAFKVTRINIQIADRFGNPATAGGENVHGTVTGANAAFANLVVTDNGDGTYQATYTPFFTGTDIIAIALGGVSIKGSPFTSKVH